MERRPNNQRQRLTTTNTTTPHDRRYFATENFLLLSFHSFPFWNHHEYSKRMKGTTLCTELFYYNQNRWSVTKGGVKGEGVYWRLQTPTATGWARDHRVFNKLVTGYGNWGRRWSAAEWEKERRRGSCETVKLTGTTVAKKILRLTFTPENWLDSVVDLHSQG